MFKEGLVLFWVLLISKFPQSAKRSNFFQGDTKNAEFCAEFKSVEKLQIKINQENLFTKKVFPLLLLFTNVFGL
jgi:hypothetical protein